MADDKQHAIKERNEFHEREGILEQVRIPGYSSLDDRVTPSDTAGRTHQRTGSGERLPCQRGSRNCDGNTGEGND